ncbi:conserved hypothetical protein [Methylocella silvestris BL2]|uniref:Sulfotransferase domain-containing protein n=1 Tax=Methylocella silvestris (strain DSM 15510 / CIP 108128 / LMG 27833 / NCIMB 13906 / BL2) TaxID=395965 RepID=B8ERW1_METSB|nr:sulfotransferase domain-containing protein [Methylocella silvestris]ACK51659.1 conserved hypothetical protein [Methylocella silvestris BL2]
MKALDNLWLNVGAMKSGTSWLARQFEDHPDVFLTPIKEIHYFAHVHSPVKFLDRNGRVEALKTYINWVSTDLHPDILKFNLRWFESYLDEPVDDIWFRNLYKDRGAKRYCAEFSNITAVLDETAWAHIKNISDNVKVTYTMRDPFVRLWSHTRFQAQINGVFHQIPTWRETEYRAFFDSGDLLQHSCYSHTISKLRHNLEPHQYRLIYFEDFRDNPLKELRGVEQFLSIEQKDYFNLEFHNPSLPLGIPGQFLLAAQRAIGSEFDSLDHLGARIPTSWTLPERVSKE